MSEAKSTRAIDEKGVRHLFIDQKGVRGLLCGQTIGRDTRYTKVQPAAVTCEGCVAEIKRLDRERNPYEAENRALKAVDLLEVIRAAVAPGRVTSRYVRRLNAQDREAVEAIVARLRGKRPEEFGASRKTWALVERLAARPVQEAFSPVMRGPR